VICLKFIPVVGSTDALEVLPTVWIPCPQSPDESCRNAINSAKGREDPHSAIERPRDIFSTPACHSNNARSLAWLDGNTIAKSNNSPGIGGDTLTRNNNPGEIQRIRSRDSYDFTGWLPIARGTQGFYRHSQSKLLSQKAANESATPNLTAIFQAPQGY
jgi:hypothetical protein